jgi:hypothetical protein
MNTKFIKVLWSIVLFASGALFGAYPNVQSDANPSVTPYTMQPLHGNTTVQLGLPDAGATPPNYYNASPPAYSAQIYDFFFNDGTGGKTNYFRTGTPGEDSANRHFDFALFKSSHSEVFQNTTFHYSSTSPMNIYFVDTRAGFTNSLGIIDQTQYPASYSSHPLTNMGGTSCLLFPFSQNAVYDSRTMGGNASGMARNSSAPYLLSDFTQFTLLPGHSVDFFLASDVVGKDAIDPTLATGVWFTDMSRNWGNGGIDTNNFQHFQFYSISDLDSLTPGFQNFLVAIEDKGNFNGSDKDFNDLFFVLQFTAVPEPGAYLVIGTLLGVAYLFARRETTKAGA